MTSLVMSAIPLEDMDDHTHWVMQSSVTWSKLENERMAAWSTLTPTSNAEFNQNIHQTNLFHISL
jgi:hypothetical protein